MIRGLWLHQSRFKSRIVSKYWCGVALYLMTRLISWKKSSLVILMLMIVEPSWAADSILGPSNAYLCFEGSRWAKSIHAIGYCDKAIAENEFLSKRDLAATYSNRGIIYSANGQYDLAIRDHNRAIAIKALLGQAIANRGNVYFRMGEYKKALTDYDQALTSNGEVNATIYLNRGLVLLEMKNFEQAKLSLMQAQVLNPDSSQIKKLLEEVTSL